MSLLANGMRLSVLLSLLTLSGCANWQTIDRSKSVPLASGKGKAIHLDAQQRLVVFSAERYCAEPSPDALAAYAAALGLSGSQLPSKSVAASGALNSMAGSIGLRTQSITLMRDTLYRTCEASLNGRLSDSQVAVLMARSQDLTVVILAIEQLTGAVVAPPIALTSSGNSSAASTLMANTAALNQAREAEAKAKALRDTAETLKNDAETAYKSAQTETERLRVESAAAPADVAKSDLLAKQRGIQEEKRKAYEAALLDFNNKDSAYTLNKQTADKIATLQDASSNLTTAGAAGSGQVGDAILYRSPGVSDSATKDISLTVKALVTTLLEKTYFQDACLAILMQPSEVEKVTNQLRYLTEKQRAGLSLTDPLRITRASAEVNQADATAQTLIKDQAAIKATCLAYFNKLGS